MDECRVSNIEFASQSQVAPSLSDVVCMQTFTIIVTLLMHNYYNNNDGNHSTTTTVVTVVS